MAKQHMYIDFDIDKARAVAIPDSAEVKTTMGVIRQGERYRETLQKIASGHGCPMALASDALNT